MNEICTQERNMVVATVTEEEKANAGRKAREGKRGKHVK